MGLAEDASIITRALFESNLALHFILKPRMPLKENGRKVSAPRGNQAQLCPGCRHVIKRAMPALKLKKLDTTARAKLYVAFNCIEREKELDAYLNKGMHDTAAVLGDEKEIRDSAKAARRGIGSGWVKRQEKTTYAGISIRDLADTYKLLPYYLSIYRHQSKGVHGMNAGLYFDGGLAEGTFKLNLGPDSKRVNHALFIASAIMAGAIQLLDKRLGLGFAEEVDFTMRYLKVRSHEL